MPSVKQFSLKLTLKEQIMPCNKEFMYSKFKQNSFAETSWVMVGLRVGREEISQEGSVTPFAG